MASTAVVNATEQEAPKTATEKKAKAPKKAATKKAAAKNGLSATERKRDMAEAKTNGDRLRKKYAPTFKSVAPGVRTNSASGKFEVLVTKYVGAFDSLKAAQKARQDFIEKVAKIKL